MDDKRINLFSVGLIVAATAFLTLFLELLISRFFMFYFGQAGCLFAIPFALIGMALGGFAQRTKWGPRFGPGFCLRRFAEFSAAALILLFALCNDLLPPADDLGLLLYKTLIFGILFLIPFFIGGFLLTKIFDEYRQSIGRLYFADLASGAVACFCVPLLFHYFDAQPIILVFLGISFLAAAAAEKRRALLPLGMLAAIIVLTVTGILFKETPNLNRLKAINPNQKTPVVEIKKRWNEHSRVSLYAFIDPEKKTPRGYRIAQDDAVSNVYLTGYRQKSRLGPEAWRNYPESVPWVLGMDVEKVLVLFAGCGKDMIAFDAVSRGAADITGLELNPAVKDFCIETPELKSLRLKDFYKKKNVHLVIAEGRNYLEQNSDAKYDVIFIAASGAAISNLKQASSRKYLETTEAYRLYRAHLHPDGLIVFGHQQGLYRLDTLKRIQAEISDRPFSQSIIVGNGFIAYKPDGFTEAELRRSSEDHRKNPRQYQYIPRSPRNSRRITRLIEGRLQDPKVMTDDRPFAYPIQWASLAPASWTGGKSVQSEWMTLEHRSRVIPVMFLLLLILVAFGINRWIGKRDQRLKKTQIAYFVVTGFAYMCIEMGLIGKYDLFLGNPLYSMALITAAFLLWNGLGSLCVGWVRKRFSLEVLAGAALVMTLLSVLTTETVVPQLIGLGLAAKIPLVMVLIFPVGFLLGMFFPYGVSMNEDQPTFNVPSAYAFSVLSSVLGGAYALAVMMNVGYRNLLLHSAACYALLGTVVVLYRVYSRTKAS